jgi:hypothetical protein
MNPFEITHDGVTYKVNENESGYLVTFPDGHQSLLEKYMDSNDEPAFAFDIALAESLGHHIRRQLDLE